MGNNTANRISVDFQDNEAFFIPSNIGSPRNFSRHATIGQIESVLRVAERMVDVSNGIVEGLNQYEQYTHINRLVLGLHNDLAMLSVEIKKILPD